MEQAKSQRLTEYAHGGGCGCKIAPAVLQTILKTNFVSPNFENLLVGNDGNEDAAVWDIGDGKRLISTTDFFMPIVDSPFDFGAIAAANALSDVYAMGGTPAFALAILGWPIEKLPAELAAEVLDGARELCKHAGIPIGGGHTIDSPEPIFGLVVNGFAHELNLRRNNTAKEGDLIYLTKPLGVGIVTTAWKRGLASAEQLNEAVELMKKLNRVGEEFGKMSGINALTDVTGFGLLGHLLEMAQGSGLTAEIMFSEIPTLASVRDFIGRFIYPDMTMKNYAAFKDRVSELDASQLILLCDPQTSGGLLVAVSPEHRIEVEQKLKNSNCPHAPIGQFVSKSDKVIQLI
jgi:selenide,water dikinase